MINSIISNVKRSIIGFPFVISVLTLVILFFLGRCPYSIAGEPQAISIAKVLFMGKSFWQTSGEYSSFVVSLCFCNYRWLPTLMPFIAALPSVSAFCDERTSGFIRFETFRSSKRIHSVSKAVSAAITGAAVALISVIVFFTFIFLVFPSVTAYEGFFDEVNYGSLLQLFMSDISDISTSNGRAVVLITYAVNTILACGFFSCFTMLVAAVCHNKFVSLSLPVIICYISSKFVDLIDIYPMYNGGKELPSALYLFFMSTYSRIMFTLNARLGIPSSVFALFLVVLSILIIWLFDYVMRRRIDVGA